MKWHCCRPSTLCLHEWERGTHPRLWTCSHPRTMTGCSGRQRWLPRPARGAHSREAHCRLPRQRAQVVQPRPQGQQWGLRTRHDGPCSRRSANAWRAPCGGSGTRRQGTMSARKGAWAPGKRQTKARPAAPDTGARDTLLKVSTHFKEMLTCTRFWMRNGRDQSGVLRMSNHASDANAIAELRGLSLSRVYA